MNLILRNLQRCLMLAGSLISFSGPALAQAVSAPPASHEIQPINSAVPANPIPVTPAPTNPGPAHVASSVNPSAADLPSQPRRYVISPGDTLDIAVYDAPDLSAKVVVNPGGDVYLPLVKTVHVADLSIEGAQTQIEGALQKGGFINDPLVRVVVTDYARGVNVIGEVAKPGTYPVSGSKRFFELIGEAGGTTPVAGPTAAIRRWPDGHIETVALSTDPNELLKSEVWVNQGDTVIVSRAGVVYVVGEVLNPSGFVMQDKTDYTVLKVVAMAHGTTKLAKLSKVRIVRKSGTAINEIPVSLDKIMASKAPDIALLPDDIVFVPTNTAKNAAIKTGEVALGLASGVALVVLTRN